jgi:hypothetical protein
VRDEKADEVFEANVVVAATVRPMAHEAKRSLEMIDEDEDAHFGSGVVNRLQDCEGGRCAFGLSGQNSWDGSSSLKCSVTRKWH